MRSAHALPAAFGLVAAMALPSAANVKVTPLGGQDGEFCRLDRALNFEDPNGTRLFYDAGRTVSGPKDPRLGKIDVILVSHVHGDHMGNQHSNEFAPAFFGGLLGKSMKETGITAEQDTAARGRYKAKLAVINIGDTFTTGPTEAAYAINELFKPTSVIASRANEEATRVGKVMPGTRTETFIKASKVPMHVPLSGKTMAFDGNGKCVSGC